MKIEEWRPVVGHEGYEVSDRGRVRSLDRVKIWERVLTSGEVLAAPRRHRGKILQPTAKGSGHLFVALGRRNYVYVHHLVLEAFVGPPPAGTECLHWDDTPSNNDIENLRWGTRAENLADYRRNHGCHQQARRA